MRHSLARRLEGVKAADVREQMADIDRASLPSVTEARTAQQERFSRDGAFDRAAAVSAWENRGYEGGERAWTDADARDDLSGEPALDAPGIAPADFDPGTAPSAEPAAEIDSGRGDDGGGDVTKGMVKVLDGLADLCAGLLLLGGDERPKRSNPHLEQMEARERAAQAIDNIRESIERGDGVSVQDLKNLTPEHLNNLAAHGPDALRELIRRDDDEGRGWGRRHCPGTITGYRTRSGGSQDLSAGVQGSGGRMRGTARTSLSAGLPFGEPSGKDRLEDNSRPFAPRGAGDGGELNPDLGFADAGAGRTLRADESDRGGRFPVASPA